MLLYGTQQEEGTIVPIEVLQFLGMADCEDGTNGTNGKITSNIFILGTKKERCPKMMFYDAKDLSLHF